MGLARKGHGNAANNIIATKIARNCPIYNTCEIDK